jgi:hypothetical protein
MSRPRTTMCGLLGRPAIATNRIGSVASLFPGRLRSATEPIDDTSTGKLMEGVLAAFAQFDNDVRSDRMRAGMKAALELGRWTCPAPFGYARWLQDDSRRRGVDRLDETQPSATPAQPARRIAVGEIAVSRWGPPSHGVLRRDSLRVACRAVALATAQPHESGGW